MKVFLAVVALASAAACTSSPARLSDKVPLEIPEPPPRVAMDPVAMAVEEPRAETPAPAVLPPRPAANTPAPAPAATTATPPAATAPAAEGPEPVRTTPPPELRPAGTPGQTPTAAQVRERLVRTKQKLDALDRRRLNQGRKADYDSARRFLSQAENAVKANNLLLAESSVDKAETLADGLR